MQWDCAIVYDIWKQLEKWLNTMLIEGHLIIEKEMVFLFDIEAGAYTVIINLLLLITHRYIYVCKCLEEKPNFLGLLHKIKSVENIECSIAKDKGSLVYHYKKWRLVIEYLKDII